MMLVRLTEPNKRLRKAVDVHIHYASLVCVQMRHAPLIDKMCTHVAFLIQGILNRLYVHLRERQRLMCCMDEVE